MPLDDVGQFLRAVFIVKTECLDFGADASAAPEQPLQALHS